MNEIVETVSFNSSPTIGNDVVNLVLQSGILAKIVLLILLLFSLASWGVMLDKWFLFRRTMNSSTKFLSLFKNAEDFDAVMQRLRSREPEPLSRIFISGYKTLEPYRDSPNGLSVLRPRSMALLELTLDDAIMVEMQILEKRISFLGTCGGVTPFIGLFGTVWGIMNAFRGIGMAGSASIAAVAPGIAEALITTAAGLIAAVPAVIGYNYFLGKVRALSVVFERFRASFLASIE